MDRLRQSFISVALTGIMLSLAPTHILASGSGAGRGSPSVAVCGIPSAAAPVCSSRVLLDSSGANPVATTSPQGYNPPDLQSAYNLPSGAGTGQIVAVVDAYDGPTAESDLAVYRSMFGLPPCTTANGCFKRVDQTGGTNYPKADHGWAFEIAVDVEMVSAICPSCHILVVEATTNSWTDMTAAVNEAAAQGATEISNSYIGTEFSGELNLDAAYNHPGIAVTASSGDSGFGPLYPAASPYVTAVGGTTLSHASSRRGWNEVAWSGSGSGCSAYEPQPTWQASNRSIPGACKMRAIADVSAVADVSVSVYDSFGYHGSRDWFLAGGTSVSSPIIASVYALAGNAASVVYGSYPYSHPKLFDVISGSNGSCGNLLCNAASGWDGPTGLGTPNGTGAF